MGIWGDLDQAQKGLASGGGEGGFPATQQCPQAPPPCATVVSVSHLHPKGGLVKRTEEPAGPALEPESEEADSILYGILSAGLTNKRD